MVFAATPIAVTSAPLSVKPLRTLLYADVTEEMSMFLSISEVISRTFHQAM